MTMARRKVRDWARSTVWLSLCTMALAGTSAQAQAPQRSLADLQGRWTCSGRFEANGRPINAVLLMIWDARSATLVVHHDDVEPSPYHSVEVWSQASAKPLSAATSDPFGGLRVFASTGWSGNAVTWSRPGLDGGPAEQFTYALASSRAMSVTWRVKRQNAGLVVGDSLQCTLGA